MIDGLKAGWRGLRQLQFQGYVYIWANLLWIALSLPIVTAPAAWAGLIRLSYHAQRTPSADFKQFWLGFRENLGRGSLLAFINLIVIGVNVVNLVAYRDADGLIIAARGVWITALVAWFMIQFYAWPLFYSMEQPSLRGAFRNATVMILLNPLFTLALLLLIVLLIVVSMLLPAAWLLLTGGALASIATNAVQDRLRRASIDGMPPASAPLPEESL